MVRNEGPLKAAGDGESGMISRPLTCCCCLSLRAGTLAACLLLAVASLETVARRLVVGAHEAGLVLGYRLCAGLLFVGLFVGICQVRGAASANA